MLYLVYLLCMSSKQSMSEVQRLSLTTLPQAIIESILCLLSTEEAARTSILSREWRYKWTTIPKLKFDGWSYASKRSTKENILSFGCWPLTTDLERARYKEIMCEYINAIHRVLLLRQSPIHEFTLVICAYDTSFEIDRIILNLSRNHIIKKLTLTFVDLPSCVFSLPHLTDLYLTCCGINGKPIFNEVGSLTSLSLSYWVTMSKETLLHLLSNCPSLKSLYLLLRNHHLLGDESPSIMELFKCLPIIEHLTISGDFIELLVQAKVPKELPTSLIHLKYCAIEDMCFLDCGLPFLCVLIKCSPNLQKIKLDINIHCCDDLKCTNFEELSARLEELTVTLEEYSDVWLEHLNEAEINYFGNFKPELEFVKLVLARSPSLKKLSLLTYEVNKNEELEMLKILSRVPRISPVKIVVESL